MLAEGTVLRSAGEMERTGLHFSILAKLNPAGKPLSSLGRDLEAEPPAEAAETGSIGEKASPRSSLVLLLAIIHITRQ